MLAERGVDVDHSRVYRWVQKFTPQLEAAFRKGKKRPVGTNWRMDETYIKIKGQWKSLYRAVDKEEQTIDFLLTAHRDKKAARRFFKKAIGQYGLPEKVTIDKSGANTAALDALQEETGAAIEVGQIKYLNNRVEQDHRAVKRIVRLMLGFGLLLQCCEKLSFPPLGNVLSSTRNTTLTRSWSISTRLISVRISSRRPSQSRSSKPVLTFSLNTSRRPITSCSSLCCCAWVCSW